MNKGNMGIRTTIAIGLLFAAATAHAGTNSWTSGSSTFWDTAGAWSLGVAPSTNDQFDLIINTTTKTVTIDSFVPAGALTISNLVVGGPSGNTNTLFLNNAGTNTPLRMINSMTISNGGVLQITNSFVRVDGILGGIFEVDGTMKILPRAKVVVKTATIGNGATLQFALGNNTSPIVVSNNLTLGGTLNVTDGGGYSNNTYTLFSYFGTLTYNGLTVGALPTNFTASVSTSTVGQVNLVVAGIPPVAHFTASPTSGVEPLGVTFADTTTGSSPLSLTWNLGDTTTNTAGGVNFLHTYAAGTYTVTLTASNAFGGSTLVSNNLITVTSSLTPFQQWQVQYFGSTNCAACGGDADFDADGTSNTNEFLAGTNPTNNASGFRIISTLRNTNDDVVITWKTAGVRTNVVEALNGGASGYTTNGFQGISGSIIINIAGDTTTNYVDTGGATNFPTRFYRVRLVP